MANADQPNPEEAKPAAGNAMSGRADTGRGKDLKESMRQLLKKKAEKAETTIPAIPAEAPATAGVGFTVQEDGVAAGYPPADSSSKPASRSQALREALQSAPASRGAGRGEALKSSMRKLLASKTSSAAHTAQSSVFDEVFDGNIPDLCEEAGCGDTPAAASRSAAVPSSAQVLAEGDPWPEVRLSPSALGVEDGKRRAEELVKRFDWEAACQMWAKVRFTAHSSKRPLDAALLAEIEAAWLDAKSNVRQYVPPPTAEACPQVDTASVPAELAAEAPPAVTASSSSAPSKPPSRTYETKKESTKEDSSYDPNDWNHRFFAKMEKDYDDLCAADGWDDIRRRQCELIEEQKTRSGVEDIPADSDYFRVQLPAGAKDRELRAPDTRPRNSSAACQATAEPLRPRRNLDELRRVEAETQAAMDTERARRAALAAGLPEPADDDVSQDDRPPIRTKSDTVRIDSLSDDSDLEKEREATSKAEAALRALEEFDKFGREREERLAKWRERWGD